ncbi:TPA: hypothetical protein DF272_02055 [Candidatus Falkowbacteria bacterium]|nr:hypothetical protein [Candidatus Falkowbacteria bacterium]
MIYKEADVQKLAVPVRVEDRGLYTIYTLPERESKGKTGRKLIVPFDGRFPLIDGFEVKYLYLVELQDISSVAGHHFHLRKTEFLMAVCGEVKIFFQDIETGEYRSLSLKAKDNRVIHIRPGIAHAVGAHTIPAIVLVMADFPNTEDDEFPHRII